MAIRLVVGLGNPGSKYAGTRHNVGFMVLEGLGASPSWTAWKGPDPGEYVKASFSDEVFLVRPLTFMNLSGRMVRGFAHFYRVRPAEILVCYDDSDLPLGRLRLRLKGSAAGHRGMESVLQAMGTREIPRLRIGIRAESERARAGELVLRPLGPAEREALRKPLSDARDAVVLACRDGVEAAMNRYNPAGPEPG